MADQYLRRLAAVISVAAILVMATSCDEGVSDGDDSSPSEAAVELDLNGQDGCQVSGYSTMKDYFTENGITLSQEDLDGELPGIFCMVGLEFQEQGSESEGFTTLMSFGLRTYDTSGDAQDAIEHPEQLRLTSRDARYPEDGISKEVSGPWEDGFIWSTPDSYSAGRTQAAVRIGNVVLAVSFELYPVPNSQECGTGSCTVAPSDLVAWLHDEYLPTVGASVVALMEE